MIFGACYILISKTKKRLRLTLPAKATVFYTIAGALERGLGFIFTPIYTRLLSPTEFGLYPLYVSWMGIVTVIVTLELQGGVIYRAMTKFKGREEELVSSALGVIILSALTVGGLIFPFRAAISRITGLETPFLYALLLSALINGIESVYFARCRYFYEYKATSVISAVNAVLSPLIAISIIRFSPYRKEARIIAPLVVGLVVILPLITRILRSGGRIFSPDIWGYLIRTSFPLLPHFLATSVIAQSGKLAIGRYFGEDALAKYSLVFSLGFLFTIMTVGINSGLSPWINRKLSRERLSEIGKVTGELFSLFATLSLMAITFVPEGLSILAPPEYRDALPAVYPITVSVIISFLSSVFYTVSVYYERGHLVTICTVITALITVVLHLTLTRILGYAMAGAVSCIAALLNTLLYAFIIGGVLKKRIFTPMPLFGTVIFTIGWAFILFFLRGSLGARFFAFLALFLISVPKAIACYRLIKEKE